MNKNKSCMVHGQKTIWIEQGSGSPHRYRVNCFGCREFVKWGTAAQLDEAKARGALASVIPFKPPQTLFEDE